MPRTTQGRRRAGSTSRRVVAVLGLSAVMACTAPVGAFAAASPPPNPDMPYQATVAFRVSGIDIVEAKFTVLTVARIKGATVLYYALTDAEPGGDAWVLAFHEHLGTPYRPGAASEIGLIDAPDQRYYMPLSAGRDCLCSSPGDLQPKQGTADPVVGYAVMPELPASVHHVSVQVGGNVIIPDVPVAATAPKGGTMSPPVRLGSWPALPAQSRIASADPKLVTLDLAANTADPQKSVSTDATSTSVSLNSDVLFEFGKHDLTAQAGATLAEVAADIDKNATGEVSITGYTDSVGTDADNQVLSEQRAQTVRAALAPLVKNPSVTFTTAGKGEQDPVADNGTDQGRALNRRVTISYATKGEK
ncbi:OmpA family protein [Microbacterium sp. 22242]|uniref:OmpA family protein n=1 Tax=Microbacterium sp. 22242 TaxID=3453896 RepID=UPI003F843545